MIRPLHSAVLLSGLLIVSGGVAEARGGGGHGFPYKYGFFRLAPQTYRQPGWAYVNNSRPKVQGPWANWRFPYQGSRAQQVFTQGKNNSRCGPHGCFHRYVPGLAANPYGGSPVKREYYTIPAGPSDPYSPGGQGLMTPVAVTNAQPYAAAPAGQFRYSCTINRNQSEAGGACTVVSSTRKYSGDRCSCHQQVGTID
jgi:hypothetical protein